MQAAQQLPATTSQDDLIELRGGLDISTPSLSLKPGVLKRARNFESSVTGGYTRIKGYERFDGRPNPSDAQYGTLTINLTGSIAVGNTITGGTSGATAKVIYLSGTLLAYTKLASGPFLDAETLEVAAVAQATITDLGGMETRDDFAVDMRYLAAEVYRADIAAVPGSGRTRGVIYFGSTVYAFRNNAGATALDIYKNSAGGWVQVTMPNTVSFTAGTAAYEEGDTLTQGGASATVRRVIVASGTWGAGTAAGRLIIGTVTGGPFAAGAAIGGGAATLSGAETAVSLLPNGSIEFDIGAVGAARRVFVVDGVNPAFEFDGTTVAPIATGNTVDKPSHVLVYAGHLLLSFGNSVQGSATGDPHNWEVINGAFEFLADGVVTVMHRLQGDQTTGAAAICHEAGTQIPYGPDSDNLSLRTFEDSSGAKPLTAQLLGQLFVLDDRGIMSSALSQDFANFSSNSMTLPILPFIQTRRNQATGSLVNREKSQYRIFFADGSGLYMTMVGRKLAGVCPVQFTHEVRCCCAGESPDGTEVAYFGGDDGWVYRLDAGTSFDGGVIDYDFTTNYAHQKSPNQNKRYRRLKLEVAGESYVAFYASVDFGYGTVEREQWWTVPESPVPLYPAYWDDMTWDEFVWDGHSLNPLTVGIDGSGENIAITVRGSSAKFDSFTLNSAIVTYSPRRRLRG